MQCPICGSTRFRDKNTRTNAECVVCWSLERHRYQWLVMRRMDIVRPGRRTLHCAPEPHLVRHFHAFLGNDYVPCDMTPDRYRDRLVKVQRLDLCEGIADIGDGSFDVVIMNHVLEHLRCSVEATLRHVKRILRIGGQFMFSVPFDGPGTRENLDLGLAAEERSRCFGQADHMRIFGTEDFPDLCARTLGVCRLLRATEYFSRAELENANVPMDIVDRLTSHATILYSKSTPH